jgi:hypothetical protein
MAEGQEALEVPAELDTFDAAALLDKMVAEPEEKPKVERDPETGKFKSTKHKEPEVEETAEPEEVEEEEVPEGETKEEKEVRLLKVKLDGMEQELPETEVTAGYLRQKDYTQKTQALAEERKRFEAEERAAVKQEREYYASRIDALEEAIAALTSEQEPDWEALAKTETPEEFSRKFTAWKKGTAQREAVKAEQARVRELHEHETKRERAIRLGQEQEKLEAAIPDLKDPEKGKVLREDLRAYAKSVHQFSDDDIDNIEDHRALVILNKARLYDESQKKLPLVQAKVEKAIEAMKPSGAQPKPKAKQTDLLRTKLKSGGSVEDAAALLDTLMG